jgi:hypothetical protein
MAGRGERQAEHRDRGSAASADAPNPDLA